METLESSGCRKLACTPTRSLTRTTNAVWILAAIEHLVHFFHCRVLWVRRKVVFLPRYWYVSDATILMLSQAVLRALHKKQKLSAVVLQAAAMFPELGRVTLNSTIPYVIDLKEIGFPKTCPRHWNFHGVLSCVKHESMHLWPSKGNAKVSARQTKSVVSLQNCRFIVFLAILDLDWLEPDGLWSWDFGVAFLANFSAGDWEIQKLQWNALKVHWRPGTECMSSHTWTVVRQPLHSILCSSLVKYRYGKASYLRSKPSYFFPPTSDFAYLQCNCCQVDSKMNLASKNLGAIYGSMGRMVRPFQTGVHWLHCRP